MERPLLCCDTARTHSMTSILQHFRYHHCFPFPFPFPFSFSLCGILLSHHRLDSPATLSDFFPCLAGILPDEEAEPERQESRASHLGKLPSDLALAFFFFLFFFTSTQTVHILAPGYRRAGEIPCTWTHLLPRQQWRTFGV